MENGIVIDSNRSSKSYRLTADAKKPAGIAPQAQYVFYAMREIGEFASPEEIGEKAVELGLKTRQPASRIVQYYIPTLNKHGIVEKS
jgi:hypothetical protein